MSNIAPLFSWTTKDELKTIDFISSGAERKKEVKITLLDRKKRLRGYIKSCNNRFNWGSINKKECEQYAQSLLAKL